MNKTEKFYAVGLALPLILFLILGSLEPDTAEGSPFHFSFAPWNYPTAYALKVLLVSAAALVCAFACWRRLFPLRITRWTLLAIPAGLIGTVLWIALSRIPFSPLEFLSGPARSAFDPFAEDVFEDPSLAWGFFAVRLFGLALMVPLIEEFFLRGFLLRFIQDGDAKDTETGEGINWLALSVGTLPMKAWIAVNAYAVLTHPEAVAAVVWFSLVTWYVSKTKNIWDAVVFHMSTNLALGLYALLANDWTLL